jgi:hypothetical protein
MSATIDFRIIRSPRTSTADFLLGLLFGLPVLALVLAFGIATLRQSATVMQTSEQVASYQM